MLGDGTVSLGVAVVTWLARTWNGVRAPQLLAVLRVEGNHVAAYTKLAAGAADQHLALDDLRGQRHVGPLLVIPDRLGPDLLSGLGVERHQVRICGCKVDLVLPQADASARWM